RRCKMQKFYARHPFKERIARSAELHCVHQLPAQVEFRQDRTSIHKRAGCGFHVHRSLDKARKSAADVGVPPFIQAKRMDVEMESCPGLYPVAPTNRCRTLPGDDIALNRFAVR